MTHRRKRGTGTVFFRDGGWVALAPQHTRGEKQFRIGKDPLRHVAEAMLDAWLNAKGRIVQRVSAAENRPRSIR